MNEPLQVLTGLARTGPSSVAENVAFVVNASALADAGGLLASGAAGLALVGLLGLATDHEPASNLPELIERVERLADGEHDVAFPTDRDDDLGRLSEAVDDLAAQLRRNRSEESELERYKEYTDDVLDAIDDVFYVLDEEGALLRWNEALSEVTGYTDEEIDGMHATAIFDESDRERVAALIERVFEDGEERVQSELVTKDGTRIPYEFVATRLADPDGNPVLAGIGRNITDRTNHERELRERERELSTLMDNIPGIVYRARNEPDWPFDFVSEGCREVTGYDPETLESGDVSWGREVIAEDNDDLWEAVQEAIERQEPYRVTYRITDADGNRRWVWEQGRGVFDDGALQALEGVILDITDQKERELALEALQETTQGLLGIETTDAVADLVVERAAEFLDVPCLAFYLLDSETNHLEPAGFSSAFVDLCVEPEPVPIDRGDSILWDVFVSGERASVVAHDVDEPSVFGPAIERGLVVPVDDYGVFVVATPDPVIDEETQRLVETLVATTEAALDRLESETLLRERESELASRNRRLRRQIQITNIIRSIHTSLIGAESRAEIERTVCERLAEAEDVRFAWISALDASGTEMEVRAWAGSGQDYLDEVSLAVEDGAEPTIVTARSGESTVVENVVEELGAADWQQPALLRDFHSVVSVPVAFDDFWVGVLTVYAGEPDTFGDLERDVFAELGESIANSVAAVNTRQALHAETLVELTVHLEWDSLFTRVAREADCQIRYDGLASHTDEESRLFFTTVGTDSGSVMAVLADLVSVTDARLVDEFDDECLFEVTVTDETIPARLARHGGSLRSIRVVDTALELVVDVPTTTDVREFLGMLEEEYVAVELVGRRDVERSIQTRQEFLAYLLDELTDRQLEVLRTAYYAGFFEWPRTSTGEDVAEMLGVTQPTVNRHLRLGQQRLLEALFEHAVTERD